MLSAHRPAHAGYREKTARRPLQRHAYAAGSATASTAAAAASWVGGRTVKSSTFCAGTEHRRGWRSTSDSACAVVTGRLSAEAERTHLLFDARAQSLEEGHALQLVVALRRDAVQQLGHLKSALEADLLVAHALLRLVRHASTRASERSGCRNVTARLAFVHVRVASAGSHPDSALCEAVRCNCDQSDGRHGIHSTGIGQVQRPAAVHRLLLEQAGHAQPPARRRCVPAASADGDMQRS